MIRFSCPHCRVPLSAPVEAANRTSRCTSCRQPVTVPPEPAPAPAPVPMPVHVSAAPPTLEGEYETAQPSRAGARRRRPGTPSAAAIFLWVAAAVGAALLAAAGISIASDAPVMGQSPNLYELVRQARTLVLLCLLLIAGYIFVRAIDRLTH